MRRKKKKKRKTKNKERETFHYVRVMLHDVIGTFRDVRCNVSEPQDVGQNVS